MALTTAITAISALTTDSWFGQLLKMVLTASGVRYLSAQNGYICFGSFFGNIIIQWIYSYDSGKTTVHLPITMAGHLISLISGVGYATNTFQRETILDNSTVTVSRNGQAKDGAYVLIVGTL